MLDQQVVLIISMADLVLVGVLFYMAVTLKKKLKDYIKNANQAMRDLSDQDSVHETLINELQRGMANLEEELSNRLDGLDEDIAEHKQDLSKLKKNKR